MSGINKGWNLGDDVTYSGTVSGRSKARCSAFRASRCRLRTSRRDEYDFGPSAQAAADGGRGCARARHAEVHVPQHQRAAGPNKGFRVTVQAKRNHVTVVDERIDPRKRAYYWIEEGENEWEPHDRSDYQAVRDGYISVTPLQPDMTAHDALSYLEDAARARNCGASRDSCCGPRVELIV